MSIVSLEYLLFIGIVCIAYFLVPDRIKRYVLLAGSYFYYWSSSGNLVLFLLVSTVTIYLSGILMNLVDSKARVQCEGLERKQKKAVKAIAKKKKLVVVLCSLLVNLGILVYLKYANFFLGNLNALLHTTFAVHNWMLPLGISYYTLQAVSYSVDVYRGSCKASKDFIKVALYLSFFPHIMEGPFSRFADVGEQLSEPHKFDYTRVKYGLQLMLWGYFKKMVVADRAAQYVNAAFNATEAYTGLIILLGVILYTVQIYAEFSGCIDIMSGISQLFGVQLPQNFRQPFFAKNVQEFWQRWHITLGTWLKEYVFFPVSCSKTCIRLANYTNKHLSRQIASVVPVLFAMFFVWFGNGIWHGSSWKYIFYGLYYYGLMMLGMITKPLFAKIVEKFQIRVKTFGFELWQMLRTTLCVLFGMLIFRADGLSDAFLLFMRIFSLQHIDKLCDGTMFDLGLEYNGEWLVLFIGIAIMFVVDLLHEQGKNLRKSLSEQPLLFRWFVYYGALFAIIIFGVYGMGYDAQAFIYAGF